MIRSTKISPLFLRLALLISYFGDYCSLIGIMEFTKRFGASDKVVSVFIAYCIPSLIMLFIANRWANHQENPSKQISLFCLIGAVTVCSLFAAKTYLHVIVVMLVLGFVKESILILVNVYIKKNFEGDEMKRTINDVVTIRFFIMIFGGSLGGYLGAVQRFDLVFLIDATSFMIAGVVFYFIQTAPQKRQSQPQQMKLRLKGIIEMAKTFGWPPLSWMTLAAFGVGSFMALEYPLITTELGLSPKLMLFIYTGHIIGALVARKITAKFLNWKNYELLLIIIAITLIIAFGTVGLFGSALTLISAQIGVIALFMVTSEVLANYHLMAKSSHDIYPHYNLYYRITYRFTFFLGALAPLILFSKFGLFKGNLIVNGNLLILGCLFFFLIKGILYRKEKNAYQTVQ